MHSPFFQIGDHYIWNYHQKFHNSAQFVKWELYGVAIRKNYRLRNCYSTEIVITNQTVKEINNTQFFFKFPNKFFLPFKLNTISLVFFIRELNHWNYWRFWKISATIFLCAVNDIGHLSILNAGIISGKRKIEYSRILDNSVNSVQFKKYIYVSNELLCRKRQINSLFHYIPRQIYEIDQIIWSHFEIYRRPATSDTACSHFHQLNYSPHNTSTTQIFVIRSIRFNSTLCYDCNHRSLNLQ